MPEGPEIRRMVDTIAQHIEGQPAERVSFAFERLQHWEPTLAGRTVCDVSARGKAVLVSFDGAADDQWTVYSHNQLYGKWLCGKASDAPRTNRQLRFAVFGAHKAARLYSASDIEVIPTDTIDEVPYIARLGPDVLNQPVHPDDIEAQCQAKRFAGRALGGLLLDQAFVAGVGNYLRSEILFIAGIHPSTRPRDLDDAARARLAAATVNTIWQAYDHKGVTNDLERADELKARGVPFGRRRHHVFVRAGEPCYACGTAIEKTTVASRRLYLCPQCQPGQPGQH